MGLVYKKHTVDMTKGNIFKLIIAFTIPIMISGILQTLYNAADMIVVGRFAGPKSLAAVGSTGSAHLIPTHKTLRFFIFHILLRG